MMTNTTDIKNLLKRALIQNISSKHSAITKEQIDNAFKRMTIEIAPDENGQDESITNAIITEIKNLLTDVTDANNVENYAKRFTEVVEVRPEELICDVVRFQNNKEKWVALVGLLNGQPYEIFTGLQDDDEGIVLPKTVTQGKIIKRVNPDGTKRYDFQFENRRGYKTTVEGLSEKFNPEYWNYAKLISGILRYRMPIEDVIKLVGSMQMKNESINTWKNGVERALKKYISDDNDSEQE